MSDLQLLSNDLNVITAEINSYKQMAGQAIFEIGKRLKHVRDELKHGEFGEWSRVQFNFTPSQSSNYIAAFEQFGELPTSANLPSGKILELIALPKEIDRQEFIEQKHLIASSGEQKTVDEMTVRELREVKQALKKAEEEKKRLANLLTEERNKPPVIKEVKKVVDHTDYKKIHDLESQLKKMEQEKKVLDERIKLEKKDAESYRILTKELDELKDKRSNIMREIESASTIAKFIVRIEKALQEDLAPVKYTRAITEQKNNKVVIENLISVLEQVENWCDEIRSVLPNQNYIDAEVINA